MAGQAAVGMGFCLGARQARTFQGVVSGMLKRVVFWELQHVGWREVVGDCHYAAEAGQLLGQLLGIKGWSGAVGYSLLGFSTLGACPCARVRHAPEWSRRHAWCRGPSEETT